MIGLLLSVFVLGIAGGFHCTSMCGGLVAFGTVGTSASLRARLEAIAAYNVARGLGYVALGTVAGALGSALDGIFVRIGVGRIAGAVAGAVMLGFGLAKLSDAGTRFRSVRTSARVDVPIANLVRRLRQQPPAVRSAVIGGCTAALPCGLLHAALVVAAGTGSAVRGAIVVAAFWLGTLPSVCGLALGVDLLTHGLRRYASTLGSLALCVLGLSSLLGRWSPASLLHLHLPHAQLSEHSGHGR